MTAKQKIHQARLQEWAENLADQKAQGLTNKEWCEQHNVSIHIYNYWKKLLKENYVDQVIPEIVPVTLSDSTISSSLSTSTFISTQSLTKSNTNRTNRTTFQFCVNGFNFEFESEVSPEFLCTLLKAVKYA